MTHIVCIDNLSARAYRLSLPEFTHSLRFEHPVRAVELMAKGACDAALVPVAALPALQAVAEPLGHFGIACRGPVGSVQLFSEAPLESLLYGRRPIYATPRSRTSVRLFTLLCNRVYGVEPTLTTTFNDAVGRLLIGDTAFEYARRAGSSPFNVDLGGWWFEHTGLPFVFARWVVARHLEPARRARIFAWLSVCGRYAETTEGITRLAETYEPMPREEPLLRDYYQRVHPLLTAEDLAGEARFHAYLKENAHADAATVA